MKTSYFPVIISWMKEKYKFILAVIAGYLFFLLVNLPATVVINAFELPANVRVMGISGTAWSGKIHNLYISGVKLGTVSWDLQPAYLLIGTVSADVLVEKNKQHIKSQVKLSPTGKLELQETRFNINLSSLQPLIYGMPFSYGGVASGYFPVSQFYKNNFIAVNGKLKLREIEMLSPQRQAFGGLDVDFQAEKDGMTSARLKDNGEQLSVSGNFTINKTGLFQLSAKLAAKQKGSSLERVVSFLGPKDRNGQVQLNNRFKLW